MYAIATTTEEGSFCWYMATVGGPTEDPAKARKFSIAADAVLWADGRKLNPDYFTVLGLLPSVMAEARAQHTWNHRHCHNGRAA